MKKVLTALMLLATTVAYSHNGGYFSEPARYGDAERSKAERGYLHCLEATNDGVVESALAHVAMMKLAVPAGGLEMIESRVREISRTSPSPELRYKAFLTDMVLTHPETFAALVTTGFETPDALFGALAGRLVVTAR